MIFLSIKSGAWLVYISTDYVFDGKNPPYSIDAAPTPLNEYGATKLAGEKATLTAYPSAIVLRVPSTGSISEWFDWFVTAVM